MIAKGTNGGRKLGLPGTESDEDFLFNVSDSNNLVSFSDFTPEDDMSLDSVIDRCAGCVYVELRRSTSDDDAQLKAALMLCISKLEDYCGQID